MSSMAASEEIIAIRLFFACVFSGIAFFDKLVVLDGLVYGFAPLVSTLRYFALFGVLISAQIS